MTYSTTITNPNQRVRWLIKIAGIPYYLGTFSGSYDDSAGGDTHGNLTILDNIIDVSVSGGSLDFQRNLVSASTAQLRIQDSATVRTIFSRRSATQAISAALTAAATSITVSDTSGYSAGDILHVNNETVEVESVTSGTVLSVNPAATYRGKYGTTAAASARGSQLGTTARHWNGRKVWLVLGTDNNGTWEYQDPYKVFYIDGSPSFSNGQWSLTLSDGLAYFDRPFAVGFPETQVTRVRMYDGETRYRVYVADDTSFKEPSSNQTLGLWINHEDKTGIFVVQSKTGNYLEIYPGSRSAIPDSQGNHVTFHEFMTGEVYPPQAPDYRINYFSYDDTCEATCKAVYAMMRDHGDPDPASIALKVMLSDLGAGANHATYDALPGSIATDAIPMIRAGAGLTTAEVDVTAWENARYARLPSRGYIVNAEGEETLLDFLTQQIAPMLGGYVYVNNSGQLSFRLYQPATTAASITATITDANNLSTDNAVDDESSIITKVRALTDYDWRKGEFRTHHIAHFLSTHHVYKDFGKTLELQTKLAGKTHEDIRALFEAYMSRWGYGSIAYSLRLPWLGHLITPGDNIRLTNARLPDFTGGQGISSQVCEVTSAAVDLNGGTIRIECIERPTCKMIAPSATLGSNVSGDQWNVSALYSDYAIDVEFAENWIVQFIDPATGTLRNATYSTATIAAVTSSTMTFTNPPTDIAASDIIILANYTDTDSVTDTNTATGATPTDHAFICDFDNQPNPSDPADTWG